MHVPMAMIPPLRLSGKTPRASITRPASIAILIKIEAIVSPPFHANSGRCPCCFAVALSQNKEREKRQWPKDQGRPKPGPGRSAPGERHVIRSRHRGYRNELEDQPHWHRRLRFCPTRTITRNRPPDAGPPQKVRPPRLAAAARSRRDAGWRVRTRATSSLIRKRFVIYGCALGERRGRDPTQRSPPTEADLGEYQAPT